VSGCTTTPTHSSVRARTPADPQCRRPGQHPEYRPRPKLGDEEVVGSSPAAPTGSRASGVAASAVGGVLGPVGVAEEVGGHLAVDGGEA
jgi:hypothetical protein